MAPEARCRASVWTPGSKSGDKLLPGSSVLSSIYSKPPFAKANQENPELLRALQFDLQTHLEVVTHQS